MIEYESHQYKVKLGFSLWSCINFQKRGGFGNNQSLSGEHNIHIKYILNGSELFLTICIDACPQHNLLRTYYLPDSELISGWIFNKWMKAFITSVMVSSQVSPSAELFKQVGDKWDLNIGLRRFSPHAAGIMIPWCTLTRLCSLSTWHVLLRRRVFFILFSFCQIISSYHHKQSKTILSLRWEQCLVMFMPQESPSRSDFALDQEYDLG